MRIKVMSDLHLEFHNDHGREFIDSLNSDGVDVLVLAGDITTSGNGISRTIRRFCDKFSNVVYVAGNHEYYGCTLNEIHRMLSQLSEDLDNFHWLNKSSVEIDGQRFLGGTLWFKDDPEAVFFRDKIGDFKHILGLDSWVHSENREAVEFLEQDVREGDVVVTHHLPTWMSVKDKFANSQLNRFYVCDMQHVILDNKPKMWIHGHTHENCDYVLEDTRVVCNPLGYRGHCLNQNFNCDLVVEL